MGTPTSPDRAAFDRAAAVVARHFPATPLLQSRVIGPRLGIDLWFKLDCVTPVRTFKLRGALNKLEALRHRDPGVGFITASAGNHGLAVAWAGRAFGRRATVVVPVTANPQKVAAIRAEGAVVVPHGGDYQEAFDHSLALAASSGAAHVHAYDDLDIIAGQGTLVLELPTVDAVVCGVGGGGLLAGVASALVAHGRTTAAWGVQPIGAASMVRALSAGHPVALEAVTTIADGLGARITGVHTLELVRAHARGVVTVTDDELVEAVRQLAHDERLVVEPAGAAGVAGLLVHRGIASGRVVAILSGANISDELWTRVRDLG